MLQKIRSTFLYQKLRSFYKTGHEKKMLALRLGMYKKFINPGDLVFDVGANIGSRVEAFLKLKAKVVAVEPQAFCRKVLRARFGNRITIIKQGLGEKEEMKTLFIASASSQIASFSEDWIDAVKQERFSNAEWDKNEQIELTTLQKLIDQFGVPAFIKIDVEGFELAVLSGLQTAVPALSFEYTVPEQAGKAIKCLEKVNALSGNYVYNYSCGEEMNFELAEFCDFETFKNILNSEAFLKTSNGDVYVKLKN